MAGVSSVGGSLVGVGWVSRKSEGQRERERERERPRSGKKGWAVEFLQV